MILFSICIIINIDFERICLLQENSRAALFYTMGLGQNADQFNGEFFYQTFSQCTLSITAQHLQGTAKTL